MQQTLLQLYIVWTHKFYYMVASHTKNLLRPQASHAPNVV